VVPAIDLRVLLEQLGVTLLVDLFRACKIGSLKDAKPREYVQALFVLYRLRGLRELAADRLAGDSIASIQGVGESREAGQVAVTATIAFGQLRSN
jgi:hypothetical protein